MGIVLLVVAAVPALIALIADLAHVPMQFSRETVAHKRHAITGAAVLLLGVIVVGAEQGFTTTFDNDTQQHMNRVLMWGFGLIILACLLPRTLFVLGVVNLVGTLLGVESVLSLEWGAMVEPFGQVVTSRGGQWAIRIGIPAIGGLSTLLGLALSGQQLVYVGSVAVEGLQQGIVTVAKACVVLAVITGVGLMIWFIASGGHTVASDQKAGVKVRIHASFSRSSLYIDDGDGERLLFETPFMSRLRPAHCSLSPDASRVIFTLTDRVLMISADGQRRILVLEGRHKLPKRDVIATGMYTPTAVKWLDDRTIEYGPIWQRQFLDNGRRTKDVNLYYHIILGADDFPTEIRLDREEPD